MSISPSGLLLLIWWFCSPLNLVCPWVFWVEPSIIITGCGSCPHMDMWTIALPVQRQQEALLTSWLTCCVFIHLFMNSVFPDKPEAQDRCCNAFFSKLGPPWTHWMVIYLVGGTKALSLVATQRKKHFSSLVLKDCQPSTPSQTYT